MNFSEKDWEQWINANKAFMMSVVEVKKLNIPQPLQDIILTFYDFSWSKAISEHLSMLAKQNDVLNYDKYFEILIQTCGTQKEIIYQIYHGHSSDNKCRPCKLHGQHLYQGLSYRSYSPNKFISCCSFKLLLS